jgi:transposase-like protein
VAKQHGIKQDTVARWKKRAVVEDRATGPEDPPSTVLSIEEKTAAVAFHR